MKINDSVNISEEWRNKYAKDLFCGTIRGFEFNGKVAVVSSGPNQSVLVPISALTVTTNISRRWRK